MSTTLLSWISVLNTCSTLISKPNTIWNDPTSLSSSLVISESPWSLIGSIAPPDCVSILLDDIGDFDQAYDEVVKSRLEINMFLIISDASVINDTLIGHPRLKMDVLIRHQKHPEVIVDHHHISPFDQNGKAKEKYVRAAYLPFPPYIISPGNPDLNILPVGMDVSILQLLAKHLDFEVEFVNKLSFNGMINALRWGDAEVAISHPNIILPRYKYGLDVLALHNRDFVLVQRHPRPEDTFYALVSPFSNEVWWGILITATAVTIYFTISQISYTDKFKIAFDNILIGYITLVGQSVSWTFIRKEQFKANFIILLLWITMSFIISSAYETNLLANLVKVNLEVQPQTFQELLDTKASLYIIKNSSIDHLLARSPFKVHREVYAECLLKRGGYYPTLTISQEVVQKIMTENTFTFLGLDALVMYSHIMTFAKERLPGTPIGYYYSLHLPLKDEVNKNLHYLRDSGIIKKLKDKFNDMVTKPRTTSQRSGEVILQLRHVSPTLIFLEISTLISFLVFLFMEFLHAADWRARVWIFQSISHTSKTSSTFYPS